MFREMRRKDRETSKEDAEKLLIKGEYGILATVDEAIQPYAVPLSYVYIDGCIYFHCATEGQKLDNIKLNEKVSFCVVGNTKVLPDKFSTVYQSTVVFGSAKIVENKDEKNNALLALIEKYSPDFRKSGIEYIDRASAATVVVKISVEHITGKSRDE